MIELPLPETVDMMLSLDYKQRFRAEYHQLRTRLVRLRAMLHKWDNLKLDFEPDCPRSLYDIQVRAMTEYLAVLEARAKIENVEL